MAPKTQTPVAIEVATGALFVSGEGEKLLDRFSQTKNSNHFATEVQLSTRFAFSWSLGVVAGRFRLFGNRFSTNPAHFQYPLVEGADYRARAIHMAKGVL